MAFWRKKPYDRSATLAEAEKARGQGRRARAVKLYRAVLAKEPNNAVVHGKIAPLLARKRKLRGEALASFRLAAQGQLKAGFTDRAIALYVQAAAFFPLETELWEEIARLDQVRGRRADAIGALTEGAGHLGKARPTRPEAARLLRKALEIEPWHLEATLQLAGLLARDGEKQEALALLEDVANRVRGKGRRRVRHAMFRLSPTPGNAWRWMAAK
ncbi:MAG TPA: tetratricopeptide repeat protein [Anaeromyxobacteraceae bacterium]|nr:tetratricopeptide repeat protein [Anaeromyxobacteraceae bacterium]